MVVRKTFLSEGCVILVLMFSFSTVKSESCPHLKTAGYTVPSGDITLEYGQDLEIYCILNDPICSSRYNSSADLSIEMTNISQSTEVVNCSTIRLYVRKHPKVSSVRYSCMLSNKAHNKKDLVCSNIVSVGTKPQDVAPKDLKCRSYNYENLTCTWPAHNNYVRTDYKLSYILDNFKTDMHRCPEKVLTHSTSDDMMMSCTWGVSTTPQYRSAHKDMIIRLEISNVFGSVARNYSFEHFKYVIPNKPEHLKGEATSEHSIKLTWHFSLNMMVFKEGVHHRIMYLVSKENVWSKPIIIKNMRKQDRFPKPFEYELTGLKYAHGLYDIRVAMRSAIADESDDSLWSANSFVTVFTKSKIPDRPPPTDTGSFEISYTPNRTINVYWQQLGELEENGENFTYHIECVEDSDLRPTQQQRNFAKFDNVKDQNYTFRVWSKNAVGRSLNYSTVFVASSMYTSSLRPPSNLMKEDKQNGQYNLSWERPYLKDGMMLDNYTIFWCDGSRERPYLCDGIMNWTVIPKNTTNFTPDFHTNHKIYQFAISANWRGISSGMTWAECTFLEGRGIGKINLVYAKGDMKPTSITVAWKLECANKIGSVTGFVISYCPLLNPGTENTECKGDIKKKMIDGDARIEEATIDTLKPYTLYKIQVKVRSRQSESQWSDPIFNHTSEMAPTVPRNIQVTYVSNNSVGLSWKKPSQENGVINRFEVYANGNKMGDINNQEDKEFKSREDFTYKLTDLDSYTTYHIGVQACTIACSEPAIVTVTTKKGVPSVVRQVGSFLENSSLVVNWSPPEKTSGRIDYYELLLSTSHDQSNTISVNVTEPRYLMHSCRDNEKYEHFYVSIRAVNIDEQGVKLAGKWSSITELPCSQSSRKTWLTIGIVFGVIAFFGSMVFLFKRLYDQYNGVKRLDPKLPDGLQAVMNTLEKGKHIDDDDHNMPADELPMLKKFPSQTRTLSQGDDSSGLSSGNDSTLSSVHSSGCHLSTDSGTEQHSPTLSVGEKDNISLRQRTSANKPVKKTGYMTVSEMNELGRNKSQLVPGSYSMLGMLPVKKAGNEPESDYLSLDGLPKMPFIQPTQTSPDHTRPNAHGYVPCTPQEPAAQNTEYVMAGIPSREIKPPLLQPRQDTIPCIKPTNLEPLKMMPSLVWPAFSETSNTTPKEGYVCVGDSLPSPPNKELDLNLCSTKGYVPHSKFFEGKSFKED